MNRAGCVVLMGVAVAVTCCGNASTPKKVAERHGDGLRILDSIPTELLPPGGKRACSLFKAARGQDRFIWMVDVLHVLKTLEGKRITDGVVFNSKAIFELLGDSDSDDDSSVSIFRLNSGEHKAICVEWVDGIFVRVWYKDPDITGRKAGAETH